MVPGLHRPDAEDRKAPRPRDEHGAANVDRAVIVSHPARVLFVHVQTTGGSTVQSVLLDRLPGAEQLADLPGCQARPPARRC